MLLSYVNENFGKASSMYIVFAQKVIALQLFSRLEQLHFHSTELEFLKSLWGLGTEEEQGYLTGPSEPVFVNALGARNHVTWLAGTTNRVVLPAHRMELIPGLLKRFTNKCSEPVLLNVYGAPELIPRNEFRQPMQPGRPVRKPYSSSVPSPHRLFKNSSSESVRWFLRMQRPQCLILKGMSLF